MTANAVVAENLRTALVSCGSVGLLTALAALLGRAALMKTGVRPRSRLERALIEVGAGLGLLTYLPFLLSIGRHLTPTAVRYALLVLFCTAVIGLRPWRARLAPNFEPESAPESGTGWIRLVAVVCGVFLLAVFVCALTPMMDYDGLCYHVFAPRRWLHLGALRRLPTVLNTEWPMGQEMLFTLLLPLGGADACKPLVATAALLAAGAVWALAARLATRSAAWVAAGLFLLITGVPAINTTSVEVMLALFTTLAGLALTASAQAEDPQERRRWLLLSAVFAGDACCIKLTGLLALVFVCAAVLTVRARQGERPIRCAADAGTVAAIALLCASPWYVRAWLDTGNPVYPFAYGLFGGRDWSPDAARRLATYFHLFGLPGATLAARQAILVRHLAKFAAVTLVALVLPAPRWARGMLLLAGGFTLAQLSSTDQWRFLLPAVALVAVVAGDWVARLSARGALVGWGTALAMGIAVRPAVQDAVNDLPSVVGSKSRFEILRREVLPMAGCLWANRNLPPTARVLFALDSRAYFLDRDVYWTSPIVQHRIVYDSQAAFDASLQREGLTHLLVNRNLYHNPEFQFEERVGWRARERAYVEALAARSQRLWSDANVSLYQLPPLPRP